MNNIFKNLYNKYNKEWGELYVESKHTDDQNLKNSLVERMNTLTEMMDALKRRTIED